MKKLLIIILSFITLSLSAATYYVSPTGNNGAAGTIGSPWQTFQKAFNTAVAGDTVYFRGGVYYTTGPQGSDESGTALNPICYFNYPGEKPIVDGINKTEPSYGIFFDNVQYVHVKGITVRYHFQIEADDNSAFGFYFYNCGNYIIENCTAHNIGYRGFFFSPINGNISIINCDAYNICDSLSIGDAGNNGDGFIIYDGNAEASDTLDYVLMQGCRAWHCSDDGYDVSTEGLIELDSCWAIDCGAYPAYDYGNGFKLGLSAEIEMYYPSRKMQNCVSVYNGGSGVTSNDNNQAAKGMNIYNNTFAYNETLATFYNTSSSESEELKRIMRNNISFNNDGGVSGGPYTHDHNSWDIPITVTSADFLSIDSAGIRGARQSTGSLPELDFLRLAATSDLIDAGTDLGFGNDLGAYQYEEESSPEITPSIIKHENKIVKYLDRRVSLNGLPFVSIKYGALYNWYAATDVRNICSVGWHLPSQSEFTILYNYIGGGTVGTKLLCEPNLLYWDDIRDYNNNYKFNLRGSGIRATSYISLTALFQSWLSTVTKDPSYAYVIAVTTGNLNVYAGTQKWVGMAIRPIKDVTNLSHGQMGTYVSNDGKVYRTICIGTQEWVADNIAETKYRNGDNITVVSDQGTWESLITEAMCAYDNDWTNVMY